MSWIGGMDNKFKYNYEKTSIDTIEHQKKETTSKVAKFNRTNKVYV